MVDFNRSYKVLEGIIETELEDSNEASIVLNQLRIAYLELQMDYECSTDTLLKIANDIKDFTRRR